MDQQSQYAESPAAPRDAGPDEQLRGELSERAQVADNEATQLEIRAGQWRRMQSACIAALKDFDGATQQDGPF